MSYYNLHFYEANLDSPEEDCIIGPCKVEIKAENLVEARSETYITLSNIGGSPLSIVAARIKRSPKGKWHNLVDHIGLFAKRKLEGDVSRTVV